MEVVCGVIRDSDGRILICQRGKGRHLEGKWEFPGGKIEDGEGAEEALRREIDEELGIAIEVGAELHRQVRWQAGDVEIFLRAFGCKFMGGEVELREHESCRWCTLDELGEMERAEWAEADLPFLDELLP